MSDDLPAPLVAREVDLKGFSSFMLDVDRLLGSELVAIATPEEGWAALMLWARAWKQAPPGSLPDDDQVLAGFSGAGKRWPKVKKIALRGFVKCSDGRLYHPILAADANNAWAKRQCFQEANEARNERQKRWRERVRQVSAELRKLGINPPRNATLETLEGLLRDTMDCPEPSTVDDHVDVYMPSTVDGGDGAEMHNTVTVTVTESAKADVSSSLRSDGGVPARAGRKPKLKSGQISDDWVPSETDIAQAKRVGLPEAEIPRQVQLFRDYYLGTGKPGANWSARWRTWCDRAVNGWGSRPAAAPRASPPGRYSGPTLGELASVNHLSELPLRTPDEPRDRDHRQRRADPADAGVLGFAGRLHERDRDDARGQVLDL